MKMINGDTQSYKANIDFEAIMASKSIKQELVGFISAAAKIKVPPKHPLILLPGKFDPEKRAPEALGRYVKQGTRYTIGVTTPELHKRGAPIIAVVVEVTGEIWDSNPSDHPHITVAIEDTIKHLKKVSERVQERVRDYMGGGDRFERSEIRAVIYDAVAEDFPKYKKRMAGLGYRIESITQNLVEYFDRDTRDRIVD